MAEERIVSRDGDKLVIDDVLTSGPEMRHRRMRVDERADAIDQIVDFEPDGRQRAGEVDPRGLPALFEGTFVVTDDSKVSDVTTTVTSCNVLGRIFPCVVHSARQSVGGIVCTTNETDSEEFAWTHVGAAFVEPDGRVLYRAEVVELSP